MDFLVQRRRNTGAAERLMRKLLKRQGFAPATIVTDKLGSWRQLRHLWQKRSIWGRGVPGFNCSGVTVQLAVPLVAYDELLVCIEHSKALHHIIQGRIELHQLDALTFSGESLHFLLFCFHHLHTQGIVFEDTERSRHATYFIQASNLLDAGIAEIVSRERGSSRVR